MDASYEMKTAPRHARNTRPSQLLTNLLLVASAGAVLGSMALMNGGAPSASGWDTFVTLIKNNLSSSFVLAIGFAMIVMAILEHHQGKGGSRIMGVGGLLVIAYIVPSLYESAVTAMPPKDALISPPTISAPSAVMSSAPILRK